MLRCEETSPPPLTGRGLAATRVGLTLAEERLSHLLGHLVHLQWLGSLAQEAQLGQEAGRLGDGQHLQEGGNDLDMAG